jgi:hypothetical protein
VARDTWLHRAESKSRDALSLEHGICPEDPPRSLLRDPRKIVDINCENHQPGVDILTMLNHESGRYRNAFWFSVYIDNRRVGDRRGLFKGSDVDHGRDHRARQ